MRTPVTGKAAEEIDQVSRTVPSPASARVLPGVGGAVATMDEAYAGPAAAAIAIPSATTIDRRSTRADRAGPRRRRGVQFARQAIVPGISALPRAGRLVPPSVGLLVRPCRPASRFNCPSHS